MTLETGDYSKPLKGIVTFTLVEISAVSYGKKEGKGLFPVISFDIIMHVLELHASQLGCLDKYYFSFGEPF